MPGTSKRNSGEALGPIGTRAPWALAATALALCAGCIPLVTGPNNFTPAGEMATAPHLGAVSLEASRPLTDGLRVTEAEDAEILMWLAQDASLRLGLTDRIALEGQLKWASLLPFFIPLPIGFSLGARGTLLTQQADGFSMDLAGKVEFVDATVTGDDMEMEASAWGVQVTAPVSYRLASWFALTLAPFARWHRLEAEWSGLGQHESGTRTPFGMGLSFSPEFKAWAFTLAPAVALEFVSMPGQGMHLALPSPGLQLGLRF